MHVLVVGANGQIGRHLIDLLVKQNQHPVTALIRKEEQASYFIDKGVETCLASLEDSVEKLSEAIAGCDILVFTAGSGASTGYDKTLLVDLDGAVKMIEVAEKRGIQRFLMVSALQAHRRENWNEAIKPYYAAKHYADRMLEQSELNYTILRPGRLLNDPGTGKISIGENLQRSSIPREDVAKTLFESLNHAKTFRRGFDLVSGEQSIAEAIHTLS